MAVMEAEHIDFTYADKPLFKDLSFHLNEGDHLGLVGKNGIGKTTLLNIIAHKLAPDRGTVSWLPHASFSYLDQNLEVDPTITIAVYLNEVYRDLFQKEHRMRTLYDALSTAGPDEMDALLAKADAIEEELEEKGFYDVKTRMDTVLVGLGVKHDADTILSCLSGGERGKVFLAKMLLEEKDVLLLDEPTNFLDESHIDWLAKYLSSYKKPFIVISHQASFLSVVTNTIVELKNMKAERYSMGYDDYLAAKKVRDAQYVKDYESQQRMIKKTEEFIQKNLVRASTTKQAQSRRKALEKITVIDAPTVENKKMTFSFPFTSSYAGEALTTSSLVIGYTKALLKPITLSLPYGARVNVIGKNGIGKTTFIRTILGEIPALSGSFKIHPLSTVVYFAQELSDRLDRTPIDYIQEDYPLMDYTTVRTLLGQYGLSGDLPDRPLSELSGGERTKVRFARLGLKKSNLLILDEPTNNLDLAAKAALTRALSAYPGTLLVVSHEREFAQKMALTTINFENQVKNT